MTDIRKTKAYKEATKLNKTYRAKLSPAERKTADKKANSAWKLQHNKRTAR